VSPFTPPIKPPNPIPPTPRHPKKAWLTGGRWVPLLAPDHPGLSEVKWCMNRFRPFLVVDPVADENPGSRDLEEVSMEVGCGGRWGAARCS
jgi:hypothetical protein